MSNYYQGPVPIVQLSQSSKPVLINAPSHSLAAGLAPIPINPIPLGTLNVSATKSKRRRTQETLKVTNSEY